MHSLEHSNISKWWWVHRQYWKVPGPKMAYWWKSNECKLVGFCYNFLAPITLMLFFIQRTKNYTISHSYTCVVGNASGLWTDSAATHQRITNETSTCLKRHRFTAPALTSCQHQHFSVCNSFTVIILRLARQNANLWKPNLIFQDRFFLFLSFFLPA